jgi:glucokinase
MVIMTGGVMRSADLLLPGIKKIVDHLVPYPPQIVLSELQDEAGVIGAAALVLEAPRRSIYVEVGGIHA